MSAALTLHAGPILLLGASGQIGSALFALLRAAGCQVHAPTRSTLDLLDLPAITQYLAQIKPVLIINAAGYTAVDRAESEPELALKLNYLVPQLLAEYAAAAQIRLVHYSSDYVYGDDGDALLGETRPLAPQSIYARSKAQADAAVLQAAPQALILRTSWVYAATGQNFMRTMLGLFRQRSELQVVADQFGAPTPAAWVAATTLQLLRFGQSGVLNLSANGHCSWYQFAQAILTLARQHQLPGLQCQHIIAIPAHAWPAAARRPLNSRLDLTAVQQICNQPMPDWQQGLQQTFLAWLAMQPE